MIVQASDGTNWLEVILSGSAGAAVGAIAAFLAALWVVKHESKTNRELALEERRVALALQLHTMLAELQDKVFQMTDGTPKVAFKHFRDNRFVGRLTQVLALSTPVMPKVTEKVSIAVFTHATIMKKLIDGSQSHPDDVEGYVDEGEFQNDLVSLGRDITLAMNTLVDEMLAMYVDVDR